MKFMSAAWKASAMTFYSKLHCHWLFAMAINLLHSILELRKSIFNILDIFAIIENLRLIYKHKFTIGYNFHKPYNNVSL